MFAARETKRPTGKLALSRKSGPSPGRVAPEKPTHKLSGSHFVQRYLGNSYLEFIAGSSHTLGPGGFRNGTCAIQRKCACGGTCAPCAGKEEERERIQTKLKIGPPNDVYEQEADRVAEQIMRMSNPSTEMKKDGVQANQGVSSSDFLGGTGHSLPRPTRESMASRFGIGLDNVRIHNGNEAAQAANALQARAFTLGTDIYFAEGEYQPTSTSGRHLLAHELTHVLQQSTGCNAPAIQHKLLPRVQRAIRFSANNPLKINHWTAETTTIVGDTAEIEHGDFEAEADIHVEADTAAELANWEVGFMQNDRVTWNRTYWTRANADGRGRFLERKLRVPASPLRDHLNNAIVWAAPGEFADVASRAGGALSVDIGLTSSDTASSRRDVDGSDVVGDASDGTDNIFQFRQGDNFISFVSAHNTATDEWRHLELVYWSVQDSVDFAPDPAGGVRLSRDDRTLGQSRRFRWTPAADQPAIGATLANDYVNDPANITIQRVEGWT